MLRRLALLYLRIRLLRFRAAPEVSTSVTSICVFCALGDAENPHVPGLGDLILKNAFLKVLAQRYPAARICMVAGPRLIARFRMFLLNHAYINELLECPEIGHESTGAWRSFLSELRARRFDLCVVDPYSVTVRAVHASMCGIPQRIGIPMGNVEDACLTSAVMVSSQGRDTPDILDVTSAFARAVGVDVSNEARDFTPRFPYVADSDSYLKLPQPIVAVHIGGDKGWNRRWPRSRFQELCARLCAEASVSICLLGGADDMAECEIVLREVLRLYPPANILDLSGVELNATANYLAQAALFVGNDSAPMHIAAALGKPVIVLLGPVDASIWGRMYAAHTLCADAACQTIDAAPRRNYVRQINCLTRRCPYAFDPRHPVYPQCMTDIAVAEVWQVVVARLGIESPTNRESSLSETTDMLDQR